MTWDIVGFDSTYLRPIFAASIVYAAGPAVGSGPMNVLLVGKKTSAGNLIVDSEVRQVFSRENAVTAAGEGSQLALMAIAALKANPNVSLYLAAVTEAGTAATVTMLLAGTATADGTIKVYIAGREVAVSYAAATALDTIGAALAAAVNALADSPFTAAYNSGTDTVTLTSRNLGANEKDWIIYQDMSGASGITSTLTGSAAVNTFGQVTGVRAGASGSGTGAEDYTTVLTKLTDKRYARIASGDNSATTAGKWKTFCTAQAAVTIQIYDQVLFGANGTQGAATTLAQTNLNFQRAQVHAYRNSETHPAVIAAGWAALRAATENDDPVPDYDGKSCAQWVAPNRFASDDWLTTEENALLNAGVTPIKTVNGDPQCVRAITTYCLNGAAQDTRCLDIGDAVFPDYAVLELFNLYGVFRESNKYVGPDPDTAAGELEPRAGVAYPALWVSAVKGRMLGWFENNWIEDTFSGDDPDYPVQASYNKAARRIQSNVPFVVRRVQHQIGVIARQTAPAV
jgi:phage tail sheath gpL-like